MDIWYDITSGRDSNDFPVDVQNSGRRGGSKWGAWAETIPLWRLAEEGMSRHVGLLIQTMSVTLDAEKEPSSSARVSSGVEAPWLQPGTALAQAFKGFLTGRPFNQRSANFLHGLQLHRDYCNQRDFSTWAGKDHGHVFPHIQDPDWVELWLIAGGGFGGRSYLCYFWVVVWKSHRGRRGRAGFRE